MGSFWPTGMLIWLKIINGTSLTIWDVKNLFLTEKNTVICCVYYDKVIIAGICNNYEDIVLIFC